MAAIFVGDRTTASTLLAGAAAVIQTKRNYDDACMLLSMLSHFYDTDYSYITQFVHKK